MVNGQWSIVNGQWSMVDGLPCNEKYDSSCFLEYFLVNFGS